MAEIRRFIFREPRVIKAPRKEPVKTPDLRLLPRSKKDFSNGISGNGFDLWNAQVLQEVKPRDMIHIVYYHDSKDEKPYSADVVYESSAMQEHGLVLHTFIEMERARSISFRAATIVYWERSGELAETEFNDLVLKTRAYNS